MGTSKWEETPGKTQDTLEGLHLPAGLRIPQNELENVAGEREVWVSLLGLLPPRPGPPSKRMRMDVWMDSTLNSNEIKPITYNIVCF